MKVATWNVNSLQARWARVQQWIIEHQPDVLLVQETKMSDEKFPHAACAELGYEAAHHGQGQWNGVAILSRVGLSGVQRGFGDADAEARFIAADCAGVRVHSCYVPNGRSLQDPHYVYKLAWLGTLREQLSAVTGARIVGGDFNVAPTDLDCYDPAAFVGATHVSDPERAALSALEATGLVDITRRLHPTKTIYSWWDYRNGSFHRGWGLRIDLLYLDESLVARARASYVDREARKGEKPSDHAPVVVELD